MGDRTTIEWTRGDDGKPGATWNPVIGCSRVSPGCDGCYAIGVVHRGMSPQHVGLTVKPDGGRVDWTGEVRPAPQSVLEKPLHWKRPRRIFVNSLSDLFHVDLPDEEIAKVFAVMALAPQHTFQCLTKRTKRMRDLLGSERFPGMVNAAADRLMGVDPEDFVPSDGQWTSEAARRLGRAIRDARVKHGLDDIWGVKLPLPNVWLGVSIENDSYAFRANHLRDTPAAVRMISAEPLLGPLPSLDLTGIDWVVAGGESGPKARPMHPAWVRDLRDRCVSRRTLSCRHGGRLHRWQPGESCPPSGPDTALPTPGEPAFLFKQHGEWAPITDDMDHRRPGAYVEPDGSWRPAHEALPSPDAVLVRKVGKKAAGRLLDGRTWDEYPA